MYRTGKSVRNNMARKKADQTSACCGTTITQASLFGLNTGLVKCAFQLFLELIDVYAVKSGLFRLLLTGKPFGLLFSGQFIDALCQFLVHLSPPP